MVEEQLDEQTQVLAVDLVRVPVHLEHREPVLPVDLGAGGAPPGALGEVTAQDRAGLHVLQAELT